MKRVILAVLGFLAIDLAGTSYADDLSTEQIIKMLRPPATARSLGKTRGIAIENGSVNENTSPTVNLYVNFPYKSSELDQDAKVILDRLAAALSDDRLVDWDFLIGGHTDAVGSEAYNLGLSERRALSVKRYLVRVHGISEQRLIDKGFGEERLLNTAYPEDGVNRRVQITTLALPAQ